MKDPYKEIKMSIPKVTNLKDIDAIIMESAKSRDELNEIIELALDKQTALSAKQNDKY
ncbi:MAG: hypothetical protein WCK96_19030 [Methylococcales bacterium]